MPGRQLVLRFGVCFETRVVLGFESGGLEKQLLGWCRWMVFDDGRATHAAVCARSQQAA